MTGEDEGYIVGDGGVIYSYTGSNTWHEDSSPTTAPLKDVHALPGGNAYAVGDGGKYLINEGITWLQQPDVFSGTNLTAVWANAEDDVWVGGADGKIWHWVGDDWIFVDFDLSSIKDIEFLSPSQGWFGVDHYLYMYNGTFWQEITSFDYYIVDISVINSNSIWLSGTVDTYYSIPAILFYNGSSIMEIHVGVYYGMDAISFCSSETGWATGSSHIFDYDNNNWIEKSNPSGSNLTDIQMLSTNSGWACGENGTILRYQ